MSDKENKLTPDSSSWKHTTYGNLVEHDGDFVGKIAYSLYKEEKISWISDFETRTGKKPTDDEIHDYFIHHKNQQKLIDHYRREADDLLKDYMYDWSEDRLEEYKAQIRDDAIVKEVIDGVEKADKTVLYNVGVNILTGLISATLVLLVSAALIVTTKHDVDETLKTAGEAVAGIVSDSTE